jgi:hypothetical protein
VVLQNVDLARQTELVASLLTVAAIVFGILGVWVSVLNPAAALDQAYPEPTANSTRLAMKFAPLLRQATFLLVITIVLRFCLPLAPQLSNSLLREIVQGIVGFVVGYLYLWQVGILLGTLLPIERSTAALQTMAARRRSRRDVGRRAEEPEARVGNGRTPR